MPSSLREGVIETEKLLGTLSAPALDPTKAETSFSKLQTIFGKLPLISRERPTGALPMRRKPRSPSQP